jgi:hypothetical protein
VATGTLVSRELSIIPEPFNNRLYGRLTSIPSCFTSDVRGLHKNILMEAYFMYPVDNFLCAAHTSNSPALHNPDGLQVWTPESGTHYCTPEDGHTNARNMLSQ